MWKEKGKKKAEGFVIEGEDGTNITIIGFKKSFKKVLLYHFVAFFTFGVSALLCFWRPKWKLKFTHSKCDLVFADSILVRDCYGQYYVEKVYNDICLRNSRELIVRYFTNLKVRYVWDDILQMFCKTTGYETNTKCSFFYTSNQGISSTERRHKQSIFGFNRIDIEVKPILNLIFYEAMNPFYFFQAYSIIVWSAQNYFYYSACILVMSSISILLSVKEIRKQSIALRKTITSNRTVTICTKDGNRRDTSSTELVPGDVIIIPSRGTILECDAVQLNGKCIVNESLLTGECIPITKTPLPNDPGDTYCPIKHKRHTLFCGTQVIQTHSSSNQPIKAMVVRTGFRTAKGELVRTILHPKPVDLGFYKEYLRMMIASVIAGFLGMVYTFSFSMSKGALSSEEITLNTLDIITFAFPAALPAVMTLGNAYAQSRLKSKNIYCISSKYINLCGTLDVICFDKTGTLTMDGLDLWGLHPIENQQFRPLLHTPKVLPDSKLKMAMATCHSLSNIDGKLSGYPLDLKMFESLDWLLKDGAVDKMYENFTEGYTIVHPKSDPTFQLGIVRLFTFSSALQRMSVIVHSNQGYDLFTKGSPEKIASLCNPSSVPEDFFEVLSNHAEEGYRVIALAYRSIDTMSWEEIKAMSRTDLECQLTLLGLLIMRNSLKPETIPALQELHEAALRTIMVTGDNILTAIKVARDCDMLKPGDDIIVVKAEQVTQSGDVIITYQPTETHHDFIIDDEEQKLIKQSKEYRFAVDGKSFSLIRSHRQDVFYKLIMRGTVFARMIPEHKIHLVEALQEIGYYVGMCGDGANDCGALKVAQAGISLSMAEASVASPFTATEMTIKSVPLLIQEGRCSLVTSFGAFKHLLSTTWLFFVQVLILYKISSDLNDLQYIVIDIPLILAPTVFFGYVEPYPRLVPRMPPRVLLGFPLISILMFLMIQSALLIFIKYFIEIQPWFIPWSPAHAPANSFKSHDNTYSFLSCSFCYLLSAVVFSNGPPYRKSFFNYKLFSLSLVILFVFVSIMLLSTPQFMLDSLELMPVPCASFNWLIYGIVIATSFFSLIWEEFVVQKWMWNYLMPWIKSLRGPKFEYEKIEAELKNTPDWPPIYKEKVIDLNKLRGSLYSEDTAEITSQKSSRRPSLKNVKLDEKQYNLLSNIFHKRRRSNARNGEKSLSLYSINSCESQGANDQTKKSASVSNLKETFNNHDREEIGTKSTPDRENKSIDEVDVGLTSRTERWNRHGRALNAYQISNHNLVWCCIESAANSPGYYGSALHNKLGSVFSFPDSKNMSQSHMADETSSESSGPDYLHPDGTLLGSDVNELMEKIQNDGDVAYTASLGSMISDSSEVISHSAV